MFVENINLSEKEMVYTFIPKNACAVIGVSLGNSYFTSEKIKRVLEFCELNFYRVIIMIPDDPAINTYKAIGHSLSKRK